ERAPGQGAELGPGEPRELVHQRDGEDREVPRFGVERRDLPGVQYRPLPGEHLPRWEPLGPLRVRADDRVVHNNLSNGTRMTRDQRPRMTRMKTNPEFRSGVHPWALICVIRVPFSLSNASRSFGRAWPGAPPP